MVTVSASAPSWQAVLTALETRVSSADFASWIAPLAAPKFSEAGITIAVPTRFIQDWVEENYHDIISVACTEILGTQAPISYIVQPLTFAPQPSLMPVEPLEPRKEKVESTEQEPSATDQPTHGSPLNPDYIFDTFVTGKSNTVAYAAAQGIAASPATQYNPLFLYGGVGLGKTHLMHAIAWEMKRNNPKTNVLYLSAEQFLYRFIRALQDKNTLSFKNTFRNVDLLMIDDIQFIAGKDATQEEFFHTFNTLISMDKQVILTSDRSPHDLANVADRLKSRLGSGLTCQIYAPELETRYAILSTKAERMGLVLPQDVLTFIAENVVSNVRELEGALNRLAAHARFVGADITLEFAADQLQDLCRNQPSSHKTIQDIQQAVATYYTIKVADLQGPRRQRTIARPRQIAMYLCKKFTTSSFPEIGRAFGNRDHTTVMHGTKTIESQILKDPTLKAEVNALTQSLTNNL